MPMAQALNVGFTAWSPLASGVLTGKYHGHGSSKQARLSSDMMKEFRPEQQRADRVVAAVKQVSDQVGRSMAQVALAWLRYRTVPVIPILGARKLSQLEDNLASFDLAGDADGFRPLLHDVPHGFFCQRKTARRLETAPQHTQRRSAWPKFRMSRSDGLARDRLARGTLIGSSLHFRARRDVLGEGAQHGLAVGARRRGKQHPI
jgi:Aldo/keto reductase family